jgi:hypothetical protein
MTPDPFREMTVEQFGGLNLLTDPAELGAAGAVDLLNVELDRPGRLRTRDGVAKVSASAQTAGIYHVVPLAGGSLDLVTVGLGEINRYSPGIGTKTVGGTWTATSVSPPTKIGTLTTTEVVYVASTNAGAGQTLRKYDGTTVSTSSGKPQFVAVFPGQNRLAQAGYFAAADTPSAANGSAATIFFSDPGTPDTYTSTSWEELDPGDGEPITGMVAWQNELFVFKTTKMYAFYGVGTLSDGTAKFLYRRVTLSDPIPAATVSTFYQPVAVGPDGVYIRGTTGLWVTTGGVPARVPTPVDPIFDGTGPQTMIPGTPSDVRLGWAGLRMFMAYTLPGGVGGARVLVWDRARDAWTLWDLGTFHLQSVPTFATAFGATLYYGATDNNLYKSSTTQTDDAGSAITWSYTPGYFAPANGQRLKLRGSSVWGYATNPVTLQILTEGGRTNDVADTGSAITLGSGTTVAEGKRRRSARGVLFAHKLSGTGPATVARITDRLLPPEPSY